MNDLTVRKISYDETKPFILGIHYARRMPCVQYAFGLFDGDYPYPVGVVTYGSPASPPLCKGIAGEENRKRVLELNRLVLYPEYNGNNYASFLVAKSLKMLPHGTFVVSYADWGGGITSDMCTRPRIGYIPASQGPGRTSIPRVDTQGTTTRTKRDGKSGRRSTGMCILSETSAKSNRCGNNCAIRFSTSIRRAIQAITTSVIRNHLQVERNGAT